MARTIFYISNLNKIGGVEQWMYYIAKHYGHRKDFAVICDSGDKEQLRRLTKLCKVQYYNGEKIKCENAIFTYNFNIIDNVEAKNYFHFIHGNIEAVKKIYPNMDMTAAPQITKQYSVSKITAEGYKNVYGIDTEVFYNIVDIDKPKKLTDQENPFYNKKGLKLITTSRLIDEIKGFEYMETIAKKLKEQDIPFTWLCFSDKPAKAKDSFIFMKPELDITPYIQEADYLVQTSKDESYGYSLVISLCLGIPVITTDIPVLKELGVVDGFNGYVLKFDMSNLDINKIVNNKPTFQNYQPPMDFDKWEAILGEDTQGYEYNEEYANKIINVRWKATARVKDDVGIKYADEEVFIADSSRIRMLVNHNLIRRIP
jgi:glycosyltransferase involved in cell wall biosynthesis